MPQRRDARHHRRPHERRERRMLREQDAPLRVLEDRAELRHRGVGDEAVEQTPVRAVEADEDHALFIAMRAREQKKRQDRQNDRDSTHARIMLRACTSELFWSSRRRRETSAPPRAR